MFGLRVSADRDGVRHVPIVRRYVVHGKLDGDTRERLADFMLCISCGRSVDRTTPMSSASNPWQVILTGRP